MMTGQVQAQSAQLVVVVVVVEGTPGLLLLLQLTLAGLPQIRHLLQALQPHVLVKGRVLPVHIAVFCCCLARSCRQQHYHCFCLQQSDGLPA
jgi:hypothetical protein